MTLDEMCALYVHTTGLGTGRTLAGELFTVRLWDGMDGCWCDVVTSVDLGFALRTWCERTKNGTANTKYDDLDYYAIFPADTKMLWDGRDGAEMFR